MNAVRFLGSLFFVFDFRAILKKRKPAKAASRAAAPAVIETAVAEVKPPPLVARAPEAKASAAFEQVPVAAQPSAPQKLRTLEEVRADVARLRANSKERHAQTQAKWGANFAPTDFLDFIEPASPARDQAPAARTPVAVEAAPAPAVIETAAAEVKALPVSARALDAKASAAFEHVPVTEPPTASKEFRTLEEMRADLAHLRATSKERHAQMQAKRDVSFAPTDFLDFAEPVFPAHDKIEENFAPTAYLDFVNLGAPQPAGS